MARKPESNLGCILRGIVFALIPIVGMIAGVYEVWITSTTPRISPETIPWQSLGFPPAKAIKVLGVSQSDHDLVVQTVDGERYIFQCGRSKPQAGQYCWYKLEELPPLQSISETPRFVVPNPPGSVVSSVAIPLPNRQINYAVLEDGSVWVWNYDPRPPDSMGGEELATLMAFFIFAVVGLVIGIIISVIIAVLAWRWGALKIIATIVITILLAFATALGYLIFIVGIL